MAITPVQQSDMTVDGRRKALRYLMFLKEKRNGMYKQEDVLMGSHRENIQKKRK